MPLFCCTLPYVILFTSFFHCPIFLLFAYLQVNVATYFSFLLFFSLFPSILFCLIATALYYFSVRFYFFPLFNLLLPVSPFVFLSLFFRFYFHIFFHFLFSFTILFPIVVNTRVRGLDFHQTMPR